MELRSMTRASFLKSSCGLQRKGYALPSLPMKTSFFGLWSDGMTSTRSSTSKNQHCSELRKLTVNFYWCVGERIVSLDSVRRRGQTTRQSVLKRQYHLGREGVFNIGKMGLD